MARREGTSILSLTVTEAQREKVQSRTDAWTSSKTTRAVADLESYWTILDMGIARVREVLTPNEAKLVLEVQNPGHIEYQQLSMWIRGGLLLNVEDGIRLNSYDRKWKVDGPKLVEKLKGLGIAEVAGLLDWCRYMWSICEDTDRWEKELSKFA